MTIVVAYTAQDSGTSALELASVLSRSTGEPLVVAVVVTTPHAAGVPEFVDGDYLGPAHGVGARPSSTRPERSLPPDIEATFEVRQASSIPGGLLELAADVGASAIVLGSSSKGPLGRISLRQRHGPARALGPAAGAPRPARLSRRTERPHPPGQHRLRRIQRLRAHVAVVGARLAEALGASVRAVSFAVRPPRRFYGGVEESADELVIDRWVARTKDALRAEVGGRGRCRPPG